MSENIFPKRLISRKGAAGAREGAAETNGPREFPGATARGRRENRPGRRLQINSLAALLACPGWARFKRHPSSRS